MFGAIIVNLETFSVSFLFAVLLITTLITNLIVNIRISKEVWRYLHLNVHRSI